MQREEAQSPLAVNIMYFIRWGFISCCIGTATGVVGSVFGKGVIWTSSFFRTHPQMIYLLPLSGVLLVWLYHLFREDKNQGTNMVIDAISSDREVTFGMAPAVFCGTLLTQLTGGSAGREGAALQMGGSIGGLMGSLWELDEKDKKIAVMCGMSGAFAALFGTPMAAALFSMEVISVGVLYYAALVPCTFSAFLGAYVAKQFQLKPEAFDIGAVPPFDASMVYYVIVLAIFCALIAEVFCILLNGTGYFLKRFFPSPYRRILAGAFLLILLTKCSGGIDYNGSGMTLIEHFFEGHVQYEALFWKLLLTAVTLECGFKGGEIVPTLTIGAIVGSSFAHLLGLPYGVMTACGMLALFVGVTNCPISTLLIGFELFGYEAMPYFVFSVAVSFTLSGYYSLYSSQKFVYSKTKTEFINRRTNKFMPYRPEQEKPETPQEADFKEDGKET